jgi:hypothetical protein
MMIQGILSDLTSNGNLSDFVIHAEKPGYPSANVETSSRRTKGG